MTTPSVDELASVLRGPAEKEYRELMTRLKLSDMTTSEVVAMPTVIRPAWERRRLAQRQPAPVLELVRPLSVGSPRIPS
jgi:hypothetical protein